MSNQLSSSSVGKKLLMALSGFFLLVFLTQHLVINLLSVISSDAFNSTSHFMGTNPFIQFLMQPILILGFLFHLIMGIYLDFRNRSARPIKYIIDKPSANSNWMSRNMLITGIMVMLFLGLHFYDFWFPEIKTKFIEGDWSGLQNGKFRYWEELNHKFHNIIRVLIYCIAFIFLGLHLGHGFQSAFQSAGFSNNKYTPIIKKLANIYAILTPAGFIFIALFHHFTSN
jgi:succinate dehydrogenase / fumarate reductase cytochrome b subunit